jgi:hypothetical protein
MKSLMILVALIGTGIILISIIITQSKKNVRELEEINCKTNKELYMPEFPFIFFSS